MRTLTQFQGSENVSRVITRLIRWVYQTLRVPRISIVRWLQLWLPFKQIQDSSQGEDNFKLSCYEVCVWNQLGHIKYFLFLFFFRFFSLLRTVCCCYYKAAVVESYFFGFTQKNEDGMWDQDFLVLFLLLISRMSNHIEINISFSNHSVRKFLFNPTANCKESVDKGEIRGKGCFKCGNFGKVTSSWESLKVWWWRRQC